MTSLSPNDPADAIAIIGMAGRFPGASNLESFWRNLREGIESVTFLSDEQLLAAGVDSALLRDPRYVKARGRIEGAELFDAAFFGMSPREAELTDPQQRLFLECAWEALERAGYDPARFRGAIGVFGGAGSDGYLAHHLLPHRGMPADPLSSLGTLVGNEKDHLSLRVAYKLDLRGPGLTVQTACSTSLVAVQLACQALLGHQCDMALAGGVSLAFPLEHGYLFQEGHILSHDGHCRAFDATARGCVPGDGVGVVTLKRLEDALADGDHIHAVILGAAVNNDGAAKVGYTAPSVDGQAEVISTAHALAGIEAESISYIEAHGTGTALGDSIELAALTRAFRAGGVEGNGLCALGSVKTNLGHLSAAAGVASLIKVALALEHRELPPSLHWTRPHPELALASSPFHVNASLRAWTVRPGASRRAGVSSFGFGGTNAHAVLEEAPAREASTPSTRPWQVVPLSARGEAALERAAANLASHLEQRPGAELADVAFTLQVGRRAFSRRRVVLARDTASVVVALRGSLPDRVLEGASPADGAASEVAFLFPDEGSWHPRLGAGLYRAEPAFREAYDRCAESARKLLGLDLHAPTAPVQPALFAFEYSLAKLWMSWGVRPKAMLGQGLGEYMAACLAGVFSPEEAMALVVARGRLGTFQEQVRRIRLQPPKLPFLSHLTGTWVTAAEATSPRYWVEQLQGTGRFQAGVDELLGQPRRILLEVGPGHALTELASRQPAAEGRVFASLGAPAGGDDEGLAVLSTLGRLWVSGVEVEWPGLHPHERRHRVPLPTYPFERQRYWIDAPPARAERGDALAEESRWLDSVEARLLESSRPGPLEGEPALVADLEAFCAGLIRRFLQGAGVDLGRGAVTPLQVLRGVLGIAPRFHRMFDFLLRVLAEDGLAELDGEGVRFTGAAEQLPSLELLRHRITERSPELASLLDLLEHCTANYGEAFSGRIEAISVLYPGGSTRLMDAYERKAALRGEQTYLSLLHELVGRRVRERRGRAVRILEVGGGQGTLTWPLLTALRDEEIEYHFTDIGRTFVTDARAEAERRGLAHRMRFGQLDLSRPPAEQGYGGERFDLILAFNVVHATPDVDRSLSHLEALLRPDGALGLVELVGARRWDTMIWGLARDWWSFEDAYRRDSPLMGLDLWEQVLRARPFTRVDAWPSGAQARARAYHGLVLARGRPVVAEPSAAEVPSRSESPAVHARPSLSTPYVAPRNDLEHCIASICQVLLGVDRIGVNDDFFELGADSLITLRISERVTQELGRELPPSVLFRGATVEKMARAVERLPEPGPSSPLVPLQSGGTRPPLFFVHPAAGVVFPYVSLAQALGPDQPLYGLQARGLDGTEAPDTRIEDMARHYLAAIREVQPRGPYHLGGFSFGCLVAYEMAQQLVAAGEEVGLLALVDEPAPVKGHRPSPLMMGKMFLTGAARSLGPHLLDYLALSRASRPSGQDRAAPRLPRFEELLRWRPDFVFLERFMASATLASFVPEDAHALTLKHPAVLPMFQLFLLHMRETLAYVPRPYPHKVSLFKSRQMMGAEEDPTAGWGSLARGGVDVFTMPGDHLSMIRPPHVRTLAVTLRACLDEARRPGASARVSGGGR